MASWGFTGRGQQRCSLCACSAARSVTSEGTGGTSGKKENIVVGVIGRGGGFGGDNRQVLSSRGFWLLPACT